MTEQQYRKECARIIRDNITFSPQIGDYVIHGALDKLWKLHLQEAKNISSSSHVISCSCVEEDKHGETVIWCCNHCGLPTEKWWTQE